MKILASFFVAAFLFTTSGYGQQAPSTPRPPAMDGQSQLYQVILLVGSTSGQDAVEGLPKSAEKALADVRDFLPFKRYRLLDSGLLRALPGREAAIDMNGAGGQTYRTSLTFGPSTSGSPLRVLNFQVDPPRESSRPLAPGEAPRAPRSLISTSFSLEIGETIVVGSSKLGGDEALIVLVTAIPRAR